MHHPSRPEGGNVPLRPLVMERTPRSFASPAIAATLLSVCLVVYWRVVSYPFISYDDVPLIVDNPALRGGLTLDAIRWAFTTDLDAGWIPVTWLSRLLDVTLFGMDAGMHHLVNLVLHILNSLLVFDLFRRMTGKKLESGLAALLFAVHPLHVESVAWVVERKDVLSAFFMLAAIEGYVRYVSRRALLPYACLLGLFALGLMSKAILVTFPFALLLLDFWPFGRFRPFGSGGWRTPAGRDALPPGKLLIEKLPLFVLSAAICVVTFQSQKRISAVTSLDTISIGDRIGNGLLSYIAYLAKTIWPSGLSVYYPHPGVSPPFWKTGAAAAFICVLSVAVTWRARRYPWLFVGWFWFLGTLVPVIGLVQVGSQSMADRCMYVPMFGFCVIAAIGAGEMASRFKAAVPVSIGAGAWLAALTACSFIQVSYWRGSVPLFTHAAEATGENWVAFNQLGFAASDAGNDNAALVFYRRALIASPDMPEVLNNTGVSLYRLGNIDEAIRYYRKAIREKPSYASAHYNLGVALTASGRVPEAMVEYRETLRHDPSNSAAHNDLGVFLWDAARFGEAIFHYREAIRCDPSNVDAHYNLGRASSFRGELDESASQFREAIRLKPGFAEAHNNLGVTLARQGKIPDAMEEFRTVLRLNPNHPGARRNLERAAAGAP